MPVKQTVNPDLTVTIIEAIPRATAIPVSEREATPIATPEAPEINLQPETVRAIAPKTLPEGSTFLAVLDGIQFTATVPRGGVRLGETFETMYPKMIKVLAPASLNQGNRFEAEVDGIRFYATVPPGGVREGDFFEVLHPSVAPAETVATRPDACQDCCNSWGGTICFILFVCIVGFGVTVFINFESIVYYGCC
mmetsp:Transcript_7078/g.17277  ORF Transcript_7078/g.17277 Transcript_7078/m.17277 type:complete len:194 (+) Transcript_7078:249-830(+)